MDDIVRHDSDVKIILSELAVRGYAISQVADLAAFKTQCAQLGEAKQFAEVRIIEGKKEYKWIPDAVPFHTDNPKMTYIGFYCIRSGAPYGDNLLMDGRKILAQMDSDQLKLLSTITMKMPNGDEHYPVYIPGALPQIFYLPFFWTRAAATHGAAIEGAMLRFHELVLTDSAKGNFFSIALRPNDVLYIDNRYLLHGRGELPGGSDRFLIRALISAPEGISVPRP